MREIHITSRATGIRRRCGKAICCCSIYGEKRWRRTASTTTSHGPDIWARKFRKSMRRFSRSCAMRATREVIRKAGYAKYFVHRTGHNIGQEVHGAGANIDGLETRDIRRIIPHTCFSIEPGIYLPEFGVRSEVNVYVEEGDADVTGAVQTEILALLA